MSTKPADIGERCYLYEAFGKCAYGLTCRFAKAHTTPDFKTLENADVIKACEGKTSIKNSLSKDLQNRLRKHSVDFKKSAEYLKTLPNNREKAKQQGNGKTIFTFRCLGLNFRFSVSFDIRAYAFIDVYMKQISSYQPQGMFV